MNIGCPIHLEFYTTLSSFLDYPRKVSSSDYGLTFGLGDAMIGDVVRIQLDAQFVEPA